jgi:hypothetical protein
MALRSAFSHGTKYSGFKKCSTPPSSKLQPLHNNAHNNAETTNIPAKMLYFIGLGLADEKDITVKGLEIVKRAERVYLEAYTAVLLVEKEKLVILLYFLNWIAKKNHRGPNNYTT